MLMHEIQRRLEPVKIRVEFPIGILVNAIQAKGDQIEQDRGNAAKGGWQNVGRWPVLFAKRVLEQPADVLIGF